MVKHEMHARSLKEEHCGWINVLVSKTSQIDRYFPQMLLVFLV